MTATLLRPLFLSGTSWSQSRFCQERRSHSRLRVMELEDVGRVRVRGQDHGASGTSNSGEAWISTVGLEVHAQISSRTKLFSGATVDPRAPVNSRVALFDASVPGTMPALNRRCVEAGVLTALALGSRIQHVSSFDRKHYFYSDLPAGYQITQQRQPLAVGGRLNFAVNPKAFAGGKSQAVDARPYACSVGVVQLQLEQDSGKSLHDTSGGKSLIDLNRCGVGLMEIVFEPDLFSGLEAAVMVRELCLILKSLGTCDCKMEEGSLRVDANVSVRRPGEPLGTRTELKNISSLKAVAAAVEFEVVRQIGLLEGGQIVENETRSFDADRGRTVAMRDKQVHLDYRFVPEPNLPPLRLSEEETGDPNVVAIGALRKRLPEMPSTTRDLLLNKYKISSDHAERLLDDPELLKFFTEAMLTFDGNPNFVSQSIFGELARLVDLYGKQSLSGLSNLNPSDVARASEMRKNDQLSNNLILKAMEKLASEEAVGMTIDQVVEAEGWLQVFRDPARILKAVTEGIADHPKQVKRCLAGKSDAFSAIMNDIMKKDEVLDAKMVSEELAKRIKELGGP